MTTELTPIDIGHVPELAKLVEEVLATGRPRRIVRNDEDVALLVPTARRRHGRGPSEADIEAALSVAGAWRDQLDPKTFKRERRRLQRDHKTPRGV
jgi:hypothetical protein